MEELQSSSLIVGDSMNSVIAEYPEDTEVIDDRSTDSELEKRMEKKMRLQSIFNRESAADSAMELQKLDYEQFKKCVVCQKPITELLIWALNKPHHCRCLACFVCRKSVAFTKFKLTEGKLIMCYKDFYESFQQCRLCQKKMISDDKLPFAQLYHASCFKCVNCFKRIKQDDGVELFDETYCNSCAKSLSSKKNILRAHYDLLERLGFEEKGSPTPSAQINNIPEDLSCELRKAIANAFQ